MNGVDLGTLPQWLGIAATLAINAIVQAILFQRWLDAKHGEIYRRINADHQEVGKDHLSIRREMTQLNGKDDANHSRAMAEVSRVELVMTKEYMRHGEFKNMMDLYFNPLFQRLASLETKWERFIDSKVNK